VTRVQATELPKNGWGIFRHIGRRTVTQSQTLTCTNWSGSFVHL